jgi:hypothetical protein
MTSTRYTKGEQATMPHMFCNREHYHSQSVKRARKVLSIVMGMAVSFPGTPQKPLKLVFISIPFAKG